MTAMAPDTPSCNPADLAPRAPRAVRWAAGAAAVLACLLVFGLYTAPDFMVQLADQMWACF